MDVWPDYPTIDGSVVPDMSTDARVRALRYLAEGGKWALFGGVKRDFQALD